VRDDQHRDGQAEHELQRLDRFPVKLPALVQRPDSETGVNKGGAIEHERDRGELPEQGVVTHPGGQRRHRNIAERVVEKMADQIGKQHQSAGQTNLPDTDAAGELCQFGSGRGGHGIPSNIRL
jgi:hypothetical protein